MAARDGDALVQRDEHVAVARHDHLVAGGRGKRLLDVPGDGERQVLLGDTRAGSTRVDAAMAGIDHDDWPCGQTGTRGARAIVREDGTEGEGCLGDLDGGELALAGRHELELEGESAAGVGKHDLRPRHLRRTGGVDDDARLARLDQAVAEGRHEPMAGLARARRQAKRGLGKIDDDTRRVGEAARLQVGRADEGELKRGAVTIAGGLIADHGIGRGGGAVVGGGGGGATTACAMTDRIGRGLGR